MEFVLYTFLLFSIIFSIFSQFSIKEFAKRENRKWFKCTLFVWVICWISSFHSLSFSLSLSLSLSFLFDTYWTLDETQQPMRAEIFVDLISLFSQFNWVGSCFFRGVARRMHFSVCKFSNQKNSWSNSSPWLSWIN